MRKRSPAARGGRRASLSIGALECSLPKGKRVLVVDDSKFSARLIEKAVAEHLGCGVSLAHSKAEVTRLLEEAESPFFAAVVDLDLPDAPRGEAVDLLLESKVPTIVLTASYDEDARDHILGRGIVDYHIKGSQSVTMVLQALQRLVLNPQTTVLVVDDSSYGRALLKKLLRVQSFHVLEAESGEEGLKVLESHPEITLVITDYEMTGMNGVEFVAKARSLQGPDKLALLGVSAHGSGWLSAQFLKYGADDFITKPFLYEELYCRIYRSLDNLARIEALRKAARTDQLTCLDNRLAFFEKVPLKYEKAKEANGPFQVALVDIDHFKSINDTYGHAGGDVALRELSSLLKSVLGENWIVARFGGEEFCLVGDGLEWPEVSKTLEELRLAVENLEVPFEEQTIRFTLSIGCTSSYQKSLDDMVNVADEALYRAKSEGRNRIVYAS